MSTIEEHLETGLGKMKRSLSEAASSPAAETNGLSPNEDGADYVSTRSDNLHHVLPSLSREALLDLRLLLMERQASERKFAHAVELHLARLGLDPEHYALDMQSGRFVEK